MHRPHSGMMSFCPALAANTLRLNDTGAVRCVDDADQLTWECASTSQDGEFGRDATHRHADNGRGGFHFVKLDAAGNELDRLAPSWTCVRDRVTQLTWQASTDSVQHTNLGDGSLGDASTLTAQANATAMCGRGDWRLPAVLELQGIFDYGITADPRIDSRWFPNTQIWYYWSGTPDAADTRNSRGVSPYQDGANSVHRPYETLAVRLVSGTPFETWPKRFVATDEEVTDKATGLIWRRCIEGQVWDGSTCAGTATPFSWRSALAHANTVAASTGLGWRAPNAKEIATLTDFKQRSYPFTYRRVFPSTERSLVYWTSTTDSEAPINAVAYSDGEGSMVTFGAQEAWPGLRLVREAP